MASRDQERALGVVQVLLGDEALGSQLPRPLRLDGLQLEVRAGAAGPADRSRATRAGRGGRPSSPGSPCPPAPRARSRRPSRRAWPGSRRAPRREVPSGAFGVGELHRGHANLGAAVLRDGPSPGAPWPRRRATPRARATTPTTATRIRTSVPMVSARGRAAPGQTREPRGIGWRGLSCVESRSCQRSRVCALALLQETLVQPVRLRLLLPEHGVDHGNDEQRDEGGDQQAADDRAAERSVLLAALARARAPSAACRGSSPARSSAPGGGASCPPPAPPRSARQLVARLRTSLAKFTRRMLFETAMPTAMIAPMKDSTLSVVPVTASIHRMPTSAPGTATMMMKGSSHDWKSTTISR